MNQPRPVTKIHILHILLNLDPGGLENGVVNVVNGLDADEFCSSVCCVQHLGTFAKKIRAPVQMFQMGHTRGNDWLLPIRLAHRIRQIRPDIIHTRNPEAYFYGFPAAKLAGVKHIVHSEHGRNFPETAVRRTVQRFFSRFTDQIFAVSNDLRENVIRYIGIPPSRITVIANGVDLGNFNSNNRARIRGDLGLEGKVAIGSVGRLVAVKNYQLLLRALRFLTDRFNLALLLIGDGPERMSLERLTAESG